MNRRKNLSPLFLLTLAILIAFWGRVPSRPVAVSSPVAEGAIVMPAPPSRETAFRVSETPVREVSAAPRTRRGPGGGPPLTPAEIAEVRSEIKNSLEMIYGAEKSFYSEYARYSTDFRSIGFSPEMGKELWAKIGFVNAYLPKGEEKPVPSDEGHFLSIEDYATLSSQEGGGTLQFRPTAQGLDLAEWARYCSVGCGSSNGQDFEVMAAAKIFEDGPPEIWVIDGVKHLRQVHNAETGEDGGFDSFANAGSQK